MVTHIKLLHTTSTNTEAKKLLQKSQPPEWTVISTEYQESGRGQAGNTWESNHAENLLFSVISYPGFIQASQQFIITQIVSVSIALVLEKIMPEATVKIKWPNDIFVNNHKIAGILVENNIMNNCISSCITGIGLNVNQTSFSKEIPNATSVKNELGRHTDRQKILDNIVLNLIELTTKVKTGQSKLIHEFYMQRLYRLRESALFRIDDKLTEAVITGIDEYGRLKIETQAGVQLFCDVKEIEFVI